MSKQLKELMRDELTQRFAGVDGGVFVSTQGLNSEQTYAFRKALQAGKLKYTVLRNALARQAFMAYGYKGAELEKVLTGPIGVVYTREAGSAMAGARAIDTWKRESRDKIVQWKGAFLDGTVLGPKDAEQLKNAPTKRDAQAMLAGALQAPISKFAGTLQECYAKLAYGVDALRKKREEGGEAAPAA